MLGVCRILTIFGRGKAVVEVVWTWGVVVEEEGGGGECEWKMEGMVGGWRWMAGWLGVDR